MNENNLVHIVGFSGGIDSQATALWVRNRHAEVLLTNSPAGGWEDSLTDDFVQTYSSTVHPVEVIPARLSDMWETPGHAETLGLDSNAELTFELMCKIKKRPPSRRAQFCTEKLKLRPQRRWIRETFGPGGKYESRSYVRYTGVRRDESEPRKLTDFKSFNQWFDCELEAPIADWTKQMCFDYVQAAHEPVNPLYSLGFERVGCAPCINSSRDDIIMWLLKRPENIEKVRRFEKSTGRTFFHPMVPGHKTNNNRFSDRLGNNRKTRRPSRPASVSDSVRAPRLRKPFWTVRVKPPQSSKLIDEVREALLKLAQPGPDSSTKPSGPC